MVIISGFWYDVVGRRDYIIHGLIISKKEIYEWDQIRKRTNC